MSLNKRQLMEQISILLVDDEREFVQILSERLDMRGLTADFVFSGEDALVYLEKRQPDVMILDLKMPGMGGIETLRRVNVAYPDIRVIILTGHGAENDKNARQLGAFDYLRKPVDLDPLIQHIKRAYRDKYGIIDENDNNPNKRANDAAANEQQEKNVTPRTVRDLMIPLDEYATVSKNASLFEAIMALEKAVAMFDPNRYRHRAVLVYDDHERIIGKVSLIDVLRALEPKYNEIIREDMMPRMGLSPAYKKSFMEQYLLWNRPLNDLCRKGAELTVENFMQTHTPGEYVDETMTLDEAIHCLIVGDHQSLLVTRASEIIGVLRLTDIFAVVADMIKLCKSE